MKKNIFNICRLTLLSLFLATSTILSAQTHTWEKVEITLNADRSYTNPYFEVDVWVDLEGPGFSKRCYGFWDGGNTYRVRVVATAPGTWTWKSGSNQKDRGLNGKTGSFVATDWTDAEKVSNPNRRGFVISSSNNRALQYADGTPYFIVGDWMPAASTSRYVWRDDDKDYFVGTPDGGFKDWIKFRKKQGFNNVVIISSFPSWSFEDGHPQDLWDSTGVCLRMAWEYAGLNRPLTMVNEEGERPFFFPGKSKGYENVTPDFSRINPSYFRYLDKKMDYANAQGFVIFLETLRRDILGSLKAYHNLTNTDMTNNAMFHYIRYIYNRYQANSVIFGPVHVDIDTRPLGAADIRIPLDGYYEKYGHPPFGQMVTTCINRSTYERWGHTDQSPWLTIHVVGNSPRDNTSSDLIETMFDLQNPIPIFNQEPYFVADDSPLESWENRRTMYSCLLRGGLAGVVYEAEGQTRAMRETSDLPPGTHGLHPLMWKSVLWENANEAQYAKSFMMTHGAKYQDLVPQKELLSPAWNEKWNGNRNCYWAYCMRTDDKKLFKLYFEKDLKRSISGALPNSNYHAKWFNPRTGEWSPAGINGMLLSDEKGIINLPLAMPTKEDWGLSLSIDEHDMSCLHSKSPYIQGKIDSEQTILRRIVLFKWKEETTAEKKKEIRKAFIALNGKIPEIYDIEWGLNIIIPEELSKSKKLTDAFLLSFRTEDDLKSYVYHSDHIAFQELKAPWQEDVLVIDYWKE
jgi:hypothetical protein